MVTAAHQPHQIDEIFAGTLLEPRAYQRRVTAKVVDWFGGKFKDRTGILKPAANSVLVESPTGSGKTSMGLVIAKALQDEYGIKVGWFAMRRELLAQARRENVEKGINVNAHFVSMFDRNPPTDLDLLITDEAQHDAANTMAHLHSVIKPRWALGLTATPFRTDRVKLCYDVVIKDAGIKQLMMDGFLSKYHHYTIPRWDVETVAETYLREPERWGKTVVFFQRKELCHAFIQLLRAGGVPSDVVTGESDREFQLAAFNSGEYRVLANCMVLTEGFDCPDLQTVFIRDSSKGPTIQMGGRVLRKFPGIHFKQIVQSEKTHWPFLRTALPDRQFLRVGDEWRSLQLNPKIELINTNTRLAIAQVEVKIPDFIVQKAGKVKKLRFPRQS